jgi:hypothetical protein
MIQCLRVSVLSDKVTSNPNPAKVASVMMMSQVVVAFPQKRNRSVGTHLAGLPLPGKLVCFLAPWLFVCDGWAIGEVWKDDRKGGNLDGEWPPSIAAYSFHHSGGEVFLSPLLRHVPGSEQEAAYDERSRLLFQEDLIGTSST